jgi:hypothetical protein
MLRTYAAGYRQHLGMTLKLL